MTEAAAVWLKTGNPSCVKAAGWHSFIDPLLCAKNEVPLICPLMLIALAGVSPEKRRLQAEFAQHCTAKQRTKRCSSPVCSIAEHSTTQHTPGTTHHGTVQHNSAHQYAAARHGIAQPTRHSATQCLSCAAQHQHSTRHSSCLAAAGSRDSLEGYQTEAQHHRAEPDRLRQLDRPSSSTEYGQHSTTVVLYQSWP